MKKKIISALIIAISCSSLIFYSCAPTKEISEKSGAQLWGENCNRCHNAPSMDQYTSDHWDIIGTHMKIRSNVTDTEIKKIVDFLQGKS